jgi:hypothetical protein
MSYYYEDTSHYCYTDDGVPFNPDYYNNTPSNPIYYDDITTHPDLLYHDEADSTHLYNATTWSSPPPSTSYEITCELEAYAEAAANRIYTEDKIHPAYRDHPEDHLRVQLKPDSPVLAEPHYEDETHLAHCDHLTNDNHEDASTSEYKDYDWIEYRYENGDISYDPPADPRFYNPSSHDNSSDKDLTEAVELIGHIINEHREWFTFKSDDPKLVEKWTPLLDQLTLVSQQGDPNTTEDRCNG